MPVAIVRIVIPIANAPYILLYHHYRTTSLVMVSLPLYPLALSSCISSLGVNFAKSSFLVSFVLRGGGIEIENFCILSF